MILQLISRMTSYRTHCQFCQRSHDEVKILVVQVEYKVSICDQCTEDAMKTVQEHAEAEKASG